MARPNNGLTKRSKVLSIRIDQDFVVEAQKRLDNMKKEFELKKDKEAYLNSKAGDWKIRAVYEPDK